MARVDELTRVHAFDGDEVLSALLVSVLVSENNLGEGGAAAGIVHDVPHYALDVSAEGGLGPRNQRALPAWARRCAATDGTYPFLSVKSRVRKRAGATRLLVRALKMVDAPRL